MVAVQVFSQIRTLWTNKNVVVIEGELTRFGVGNDLLNDAASVKRIIGPAKNAFEKCDLIIEEARKQPEGTIFIVALGPAAKIKSSPMNSPTSSKPLIWGIWTLNTNGI